MDFGVFLKSKRVKSKLSQKDFSEKIGVSKQTLYSWETNRYFPSKHLLKKIASIFQIPLQEILKIKSQYRLRQRQKLILNSKDPVISALGPSFVPLLDKKTIVLPLDGIRNPLQWTGRRCVLPEKFFPGFIFGFEIEDGSMAPAYQPGQIVFVDIREKPRDGQMVVVRVKGHPPICRIYSSEGKVKIFRGLSPIIQVVRVNESNIDWCYVILYSFDKNFGE